jgi:aspartate/methionine/tyrosine aminotransferase
MMANAIFDTIGTSVFETISRLAAQHGAINLGQGFPEGMEAEPVLAAAVEALRQGPHQYPPTLGLPDLRRAVAEANRRFWDIEVDWATEVVVTYDGRPHRPLMALPEARSCCLRIGSAGKTFSVTGWKVGYITASAPLLAPVAKAHQYLTFATPPHLQTAVAYGLRLPDGYFTGLQSVLREHRDFLAGRLRQAGFAVLACSGAYFLCVDIADFDPSDDDVAFCHRLIAECGVAAVPVSKFYAKRDMRRLIRLCFAKPLPRLNEAVERLSRWCRDRRETRFASNDRTI